MKNTKLFFLAGVIILTGVAFLFYKKYSNQPQKQSPGAENKKIISNILNNMKISSPVFQNNANIPPIYTCDAEGINPPLEIGGIPENTKSLALLMDDPDAPLEGGFVHWVVFNLDPGIKEIAENSKPESGTEGINSTGKIGYTPPCPPSGTHHYQFKLYALDTILNLTSSAKREDVEKAMERHILDEAMLVGLYQRQ